MTPEQLAEVRRYNRVDLMCTLADRAVDFAYLAVFAFLLAAPLDAWLKAAGGWWTQCVYARAVAFLLVMMAGHILVSMPLSFYSGYVVEKRFGMSTLTPRRWLKRYAGRMALATVLNVLLLTGVFFLMRFCGAWWWPVAALTFFFFSMILGVLLPVAILPLFYKIEKLEGAELLGRLQNLTAGTSLTLKGVYKMELSAETVKANAMLAGLGASRRVLLGDTLLERFTPEEIEAIFAHEVGHHVHRHLAKMLGLGFFLSFGAFYLMDVFIRVLSAPHGYADLPLTVLPLFMLGLTVLGTFFEPVQNGVSRHFENQSDMYAVRKTSAAAMISAFRKLAIQNKADPDPHWLEVLWMHSHPAIGQRIRRCEEGMRDKEIKK